MCTKSADIARIIHKQIVETRSRSGTFVAVKRTRRLWNKQRLARVVENNGAKGHET